VTLKVKWYGKKVTAEMQKGAARGLLLGARHVEEESKRIVPIDEGTLALQTIVSVDEAALAAAVSYDTPYAVRQHEELTWSHDDGRQAKYLETPVNDPGVKHAVETLIAREIKRELGD
jgi:hypothetical protein